MWTLALGLVWMSPDASHQQQRPNYEVAEREPPRGSVAVALGITGIVMAAPLVLTGSVFWYGTDAPSLGVPLLSAGVVAASLGTAGVIVGAHLNGKWKAWTARNPGYASRLSLTPTGWASRDGFSFGVAGRF
jgi:hypothetical protein